MKQRKLSLFFDGFLLTFALILTVYSFQYSFRARIIPLVVLLLIDVMMFIQFLADVFPHLEKKWRFLRTRGMNFSPALPQDTTLKRTKENSASDSERSKEIKLLRISLWLLLIFVGMLFINYVVLFPGVVFLLMAFEFKERLFKSVLLALAVGIFNYVLFFLILHLRP